MQDAPALPEVTSETDDEASRIPFREPRVTHRHYAAPVTWRAKPEEAPTAIAPDPSRIEAVAGAVQLEEEESEVARPSEPALEPASPDPGVASSATE